MKQHVFTFFRDFFVWCLVVVSFCTGLRAQPSDGAEKEESAQYNIGLLVCATGKYAQFLGPLLDSTDKFFCTNHNVTYFVFTDNKSFEHDNMVKIEQKKIGWPYDSMMRYRMYLEQKDLYQDIDYLFAVDADMRFVDTVGDEILGELVGTQHPWFIGKRGTYETNPASVAYVAPNEGKTYFHANPFGGKKESFLSMIATLHENIKLDAASGVIAKWHDESHLNRYYIDNPPTNVLNPGYAYPEGRRFKWKAKILHLKKRANALRKKGHDE